MTICYRDDGGYVTVEMDFDQYELRQIDFCDGYAYFTSAEIDADGFHVERKIPLAALVSITY